jgi:hypothetical protein
VRHNGRDVIRLPPAYRHLEVAVWKDTIAFVQGLDWAEYLRLDLERIPNSL